MSKLALICVLAAMLCSKVLAQHTDSIAVDRLVRDGSMGTEFWIAFAPNESPGFPLEDLGIYISSAVDTEVELYFSGTGLTKTKKIKAGAQVVFSIATNDIDTSWEVWEIDTAIKKGIRISARHPVSVLVLNDKVTSADAYRAIPVSNWESSYIACTSYDFKEAKEWGGGFLIIASEDKTSVKISLRGIGGDKAKTTSGKKIGDSYTITLNKGEVYRIRGDAKTRGEFDLTGSIVTSNKPVGFLSYHERTYLPVFQQPTRHIADGRNCLVEMNRGINQLGTSFASVALDRNRRNEIFGYGDLFRVVATQDSTIWE